MSLTTDRDHPESEVGLRRVTLASVARMQGLGVWPALAVLLIIAAIFETNFFRVGNLQNILRLASILGIVTVGQVLVLLTAGIDLSVGAVVGLTAVAIADAGSGKVSLPIALAVVTGIAVLVGLTNGLLVTRRKVPPVVATFGMFVLLEGVRVAYTRGSVSGGVPEPVRLAGQGAIAGLPWAAVVLLLLVIFLGIYTQRAVGGRRLLMTGSNERMAALSGVSVNRVKVLVYVAASVLSLVAGVFFAGYIGYIDRFIGRGMDLDSIAAALLGGTAFTGGQASFVNAMGGALLIVALSNLITVSGLDVELQLVAKGLVLIAAVAMQTLPSSKQARV